MKTFLDIAFEQAELAALRKEIPVGAAISLGDRLISFAGNQVEEDLDPSGHAEIIVLRKAAKLLGTTHLMGCDLWVTLEPCTMCAAAISLARIRRLYFAAYDPKMGGVEHGSQFFSKTTCHHRPEIIGGIEEKRALQLLQNFFREKRFKAN